MLCAKYDYKMDIAVKKQEAFEDGQQAKAVVTARKMLIDNLSKEKIVQYSGLSLEEVLELQKSLNEQTK